MAHNRDDWQALFETLEHVTADRVRQNYLHLRAGGIGALAATGPRGERRRTRIPAVRMAVGHRALPRSCTAPLS